MEAYQLRRTELTDPHLADRALLAGELALARWLLYGVRTQDAEIIDDAVAMLEELDAHTREGRDAEAEPLMRPTGTRVGLETGRGSRSRSRLDASQPARRGGGVGRAPRRLTAA